MQKESERDDERDQAPHWLDDICQEIFGRSVADLTRQEKRWIGARVRRVKADENETRYRTLTAEGRHDFSDDFMMSVENLNDTGRLVCTYSDRFLDQGHTLNSIALVAHELTRLVEFLEEFDVNDPPKPEPVQT